MSFVSGIVGAAGAGVGAATTVCATGAGAAKVAVDPPRLIRTDSSPSLISSSFILDCSSIKFLYLGYSL